jgi:hypothetical protein
MPAEPNDLAYGLWVFAGKVVSLLLNLGQVVSDASTRE